MMSRAPSLNNFGDRVQRHSQQDTVAVMICDNGCGIQPERLPRNFEPFFTTKDVGQGTGLGLSSAYDMVKNLRGSIGVESEPGGKNSITVRLSAVDNAPSRTMRVVS